MRGRRIGRQTALAFLKKLFGKTIPVVEVYAANPGDTKSARGVSEGAADKRL
jgi:hypothetical protein